MGKSKPDLHPDVPHHIAVIMDGNGRWAKKRGLPRFAGHQQGTENLRRIIRACVDYGVRILTVYAFSTENWSRPHDEVEGLLKLLDQVITNELEELHAEGVQIRHIGNLQALSPELQRNVTHSIELTRDNQRLTLCIAWNYGGRAEIVHAVQRIVEDQIPAREITEELFESYLYTAGIPHPDLVIRTSGEFRTSNFLPWQSAYSEWYITDILWPDFDKDELRKAIQAYAQRERRFGGVNVEQ